MKKKIKNWQKYEEVVKQLLHDVRDVLGISRVEGKKVIKGSKTGTDWEVDVIAYSLHKEKMIIVECKQRKNTRLSQETIAGFAYRIEDMGADSGIIVTTIGLQEGAKLVASANKITEMQLDFCSTSDNYAAQIAEQIFIKFTDELSVKEECISFVTKSNKSIN